MGTIQFLFSVNAGIRDYPIYLDRATGTLFAVQKKTNTNTADTLPNLPVMQRWWLYMADLMETNPDNSPVVIPLERVFHQA
ncbi:L-rhamnose mutarotase [Spirosoma luteum]|uniref:L-rhamnose mutarotase n=1 Tax=Spirosoma luteum TaxID=431553 RepID=UPI0003688AC6|nr:L-rhamnose mutarotase [Spirosoma luteum]